MYIIFTNIANKSQLLQFTRKEWIKETFVNKKVKRILSFAENIEIIKGSIVAGLRNVVPNGGTITFNHLTCFVDSQVLSAASKLRVVFP